MKPVRPVSCLSCWLISYLHKESHRLLAFQRRPYGERQDEFRDILPCPSSQRQSEPHDERHQRDSYRQPPPLAFHDEQDSGDDQHQDDGDEHDGNAACLRRLVADNAEFPYGAQMTDLALGQEALVRDQGDGHQPCHSGYDP